MKENHAVPTTETTNSYNKVARQKHVSDDCNSQSSCTTKLRQGLIFFQGVDHPTSSSSSEVNSSTVKDF